ncbi:hypothetical protein SAMN02745830_03682 [Streptomyces sp. Amel2xC10]|nr:hypothetical protein SAMN02745830_03682 [Streptomyces sp. Amel2xC10]
MAGRTPRLGARRGGGTPAPPSATARLKATAADSVAGPAHRPKSWAPPRPSGRVSGTAPTPGRVRAVRAAPAGEHHPAGPPVRSTTHGPDPVVVRRGPERTAVEQRATGAGCGGLPSTASPGPHESRGGTQHLRLRAGVHRPTGRRATDPRTGICPAAAHRRPPCGEPGAGCRRDRTARTPAPVRRFRQRLAVTGRPATWAQRHRPPSGARGRIRRRLSSDGSQERRRPARTRAERRVTEHAPPTA